MPNPSSPPPENEPSNRPRLPELPGAPLRAVLSGVAIDICASKLLGYLIGVFYMLQVITPGMTEEQADAALKNTPPAFGLVFLDLTFGSLISVLAGYAAARIVRQHELRVGGITAVASVLIGLLLDGGGAQNDLTLLYVLCDIACVMLGAKYGAEHNRRLEAPTREPADASSP